jgi:hypothetical protein
MRKKSKIAINYGTALTEETIRIRDACPPERPRRRFIPA